MTLKILKNSESWFQTEDWPLETSITLYELHNHNQYSIMLFASTLGGQGEVAKRSISLGNVFIFTFPLVFSANIIFKQLQFASVTVLTINLV